jgi:hypothetical protein
VRGLSAGANRRFSRIPLVGKLDRLDDRLRRYLDARRSRRLALVAIGMPVTALAVHPT